MNEQRRAKLDPRLELTASLIRPGAVFADAGCDHGHLAVELIRRGAVRGYACDINEGPLKSAQKNIEKAGFSDRIKTVLTDGLDGMDGCALTDITVAGIGGEVITDILSRAEFLKKDGIRLVLQPQSREHILRNFLAENGFTVVFEEAVRSGRYVYTVMAAEYTGNCRKLSLLESFCGLLPSCHTADSAEKLRRTAKLVKNTALGLEHEGHSVKAAPLLKVAEEIFDIAERL